ncbi:hypothetical protein [Bacillus thuringiensis]|uniref:hypothetical protein n=1 Tax=Bacillus thuringiensis TaxID=1428 RepID=UPI000BEDD15B|nr:hypothetical protein [Bacillus thuringiensis]PDY26974.1 hypothetical protein COM84_25015 [Bacillus thuringiensis]PGH92600.1 hypothetical protein CN898_26465 [Bacillus thuringiensis]
MGRKIEFHEESVILKMIGITGLLALKRNLKIPYKAIKNIYVDYFDAPQWMLRMPGTSFSSLNVYEGSFKYADEWYFLSYENRVPLIIMELEWERKYKYVIFEIDNPTKIAAEIRKQIKDY